MKTVTRSLLLSYSPISSDQLVELYCRRAENTAIYTKSVDQLALGFLLALLYQYKIPLATQLVCLVIFLYSPCIIAGLHHIWCVPYALLDTQ